VAIRAFSELQLATAEPLQISGDLCLVSLKFTHPNLTIWENEMIGCLKKELGEWFYAITKELSCSCLLFQSA
jgi:hypothetical protein